MESMNKIWGRERRDNRKNIASYTRPKNKEKTRSQEKSIFKNLTPGLDAQNGLQDDSNKVEDLLKESADNDVFFENSQSDSRGDDSAETIVSDSSHPFQTGHIPKTPSQFSYIPRPVLDLPKIDASKDDIIPHSTQSNPEHFSKFSPAIPTDSSPNEVVAKFLNDAGDRRLTIDEVKDCFRLLETNIADDDLSDKNSDNVKKPNKNGIIQSNQSSMPSIKRRPLVYYGAGFSSQSKPYTCRPLRRELSLPSYKSTNSAPPSNSLSDLMINGSVHSVEKRGLEEEIIPPPKRHSKANGDRRFSTNKDKKKLPAQHELSNLPPYLKKKEDSGLGDMEEGEFKSKTARSIMHIINSDETARPSKGPSMNEILNPYQLISPLKKADPFSEIRKPRRMIAKTISSPKMELVKEQTAFDIIRDTMNKDQQQIADPHNSTSKRQKKDENLVKQVSTTPKPQILRALEYSGSTKTHELVPKPASSQFISSYPESSPTTIPLSLSASTSNIHIMNETPIHTTQRSHDISRPSLAVSGNLSPQPVSLGTSTWGGLFKPATSIATSSVTIPDSKISTGVSMSTSNVTSIPIHPSSNVSSSKVLPVPVTLEDDVNKNRSENLILRPTPTSPLSPLKRVSAIGSDPAESKQLINADLDIQKKTQDLMRSILDMPVEKLPKFAFGTNRPSINVISPDPRSHRLEAKVKELSLEKLPKYNFENVDYSSFVSSVSSTSTIGQGAITSLAQDDSASFGYKPNEWTCSACLSMNKINASKCITCSADRPNGTIQSATKNSFTIPTNSGAPSGINAGEWECKTCLIKNKVDAIKCISCEADNPKKKNNIPSSQTSQIPAAPVNNWAFSGFNVGLAAGEWVCDICAVKNKADAMKCVACETDNPKKKNNMLSPSQTSQTSTAPVNNWALSGFNIGLPAGEWVCDVCAVKNKADAMKCIACETDNPKKKSNMLSSSQTSQTSAVPVNNWAFSGFNIGLTAGEWVCDVCAVKNKADAMKCIACEMDNPKKKNNIPSQPPQIPAPVNNWAFSGFNIG